MRRNISLQEISDGKLYSSNDMVKADCHDCMGCSKCCRGMGNSIVLDPYDIYRLSNGLHISFQQMLQRYLELNVVDGLTLPNLKMKEDGKCCGFLDQNGREQYFEMGSYGIGITRTVAAIVEQYNDEDGIIWPLNVAPYQVIITVINSKNDDQRELGNELYNNLTNKGVEVLLDNRKERAGVKFNDRDLIGIPIRVVVGRDAADRGVEFSLREDGEKEDIDVDTLYGRIESEFEKYDMFIREDA